jgi:hypothetical protein
MAMLPGDATRTWFAGSNVLLSAGEVADRLSIASLKLVRASLTQPRSLARQLFDVQQYSREFLAQLNPLTDDSRDKLITAYAHLHAANASLWDAEDAVRLLRNSKSQEPDAELLAKACQIATLNEQRAVHKREIDAICSQTGDTKSYAGMIHGRAVDNTTAVKSAT